MKYTEFQPDPKLRFQFMHRIETRKERYRTPSRSRLLYDSFAHSTCSTKRPSYWLTTKVCLTNYNGCCMLTTLSFTEVSPVTVNNIVARREGQGFVKLVLETWTHDTRDCRYACIIVNCVYSCRRYAQRMVLENTSCEWLPATRHTPSIR